VLQPLEQFVMVRRKRKCGRLTVRGRFSGSGSDEENGWKMGRRVGEQSGCRLAAGCGVLRCAWWLEALSIGQISILAVCPGAAANEKIDACVCENRADFVAVCCRPGADLRQEMARRCGKLIGF
jgi:hypothetical protein